MKKEPTWNYNAVKSELNIRGFGVSDLIIDNKFPIDNLEHINKIKINEDESNAILFVFEFESAKSAIHASEKLNQIINQIKKEQSYMKGTNGKVTTVLIYDDEEFADKIMKNLRNMR